MSFQLSFQDTPAHAEHVQSLLDIPRWRARELGRRALSIQKSGLYRFREQSISLHSTHSKTSSIPPSKSLYLSPSPNNPTPLIYIHNETTLMADRRYAVAQNKRALVLNFANGVQPGGGFLSGSRAQEETLCFASTLYTTLSGDPFYDYNLKQPHKRASDFAIVSTAVVFTDDHYDFISEPWNMHVITCAAPICVKWGGLDPHQSALCLHQRIRRVYEIAAAFGFEYLVLGAWGCGAFGNDPHKTATSFRYFLERDFEGYFKEITFAISDWSPSRRFIQPFYNVFSKT